MKLKLVVTCEHATNHIPKSYLKYFEYAKEVLETHRGYDIGALDFYFHTLKALDVSFAKKGEVSRLLVELNRTDNNTQLFSEFLMGFSSGEKNQILEQFYYPYRNGVTKAIESLLTQNYAVVHLSIHSFTPILNSEERNSDVGLLFDPANDLEKKICNHWKTEIETQNPNLRLKLNYPYLGTDDGFTTFLRNKFKKNYAGIELELNQKHFNQKAWPRNYYKIIALLSKIIENSK